MQIPDRQTDRESGPQIDNKDGKFLAASLPSGPETKAWHAFAPTRRARLKVSQSDIFKTGPRKHLPKVLGSSVSFSVFVQTDQP